MLNNQEDSEEASDQQEPEESPLEEKQVEKQSVKKTEEILHRIEEAASAKQEDSTWEDGASVQAAKVD